MQSFSGDLNVLIEHMREHNVRYSNCMPTQCDTLDMMTSAIEAWIDDLTEPNRVQVVTSLLVAVMNVSRKHRNDQWRGKYRHPEQCS